MEGGGRRGGGGGSGEAGKRGKGEKGERRKKERGDTRAVAVRREGTRSERRPAAGVALGRGRPLSVYARRCVQVRAGAYGCAQVRAGAYGCARVRALVARQVATRAAQAQATGKSRRGKRQAGVLLYSRPLASALDLGSRPPARLKPQAPCTPHGSWHRRLAGILALRAPRLHPRRPAPSSDATLPGRLPVHLPVHLPVGAQEMKGTWGRPGPSRRAACRRLRRRRELPQSAAAKRPVRLVGGPGPPRRRPPAGLLMTAGARAPPGRTQPGSSAVALGPACACVHLRLHRLRTATLRRSPLRPRALVAVQGHRLPPPEQATRDGPAAHSRSPLQACFIQKAPGRINPRRAQPRPVMAFRHAAGLSSS